MEILTNPYHVLLLYISGSFWPQGHIILSI